MTKKNTTGGKVNRRIPPRGSACSAEIEAWLKLRREGMTLREIGERYSRSMEVVRNAITRHEAKSSVSVCARKNLEPLPVGDPLILASIWRGLERWRGMSL